MNLKYDFGKTLKKLRTQNNLTQEQLAELVNVDIKHISHIETGRSFPKADLIEKFASALNVDYKFLFNFERTPSRKEIINNCIEILNKSDDDLLNKFHFILNCLVY